MPSTNINGSAATVVVYPATSGNPHALIFNTGGQPAYAGLTRKYAVEGSPDLSGTAAWQPVPGHTDIVGADQTVSITLPVASRLQFYRLNVRLE